MKFIGLILCVIFVIINTLFKQKPSPEKFDVLLLKGNNRDLNTLFSTKNIDYNKRNLFLMKYKDSSYSFIDNKTKGVVLSFSYNSKEKIIYTLEFFSPRFYSIQAKNYFQYKMKIDTISKNEYIFNISNDLITKKKQLLENSPIIFKLIRAKYKTQ